MSSRRSKQHQLHSLIELINLGSSRSLRQSHAVGDANGAGRLRRDVRETTKYIETAIILDKAMFEKRNGSTRVEVIHDAIQVANIADLVGLLRKLQPGL